MDLEALVELFVEHIERKHFQYVVQDMYMKLHLQSLYKWHLIHKLLDKDCCTYCLSILYHWDNQH